MSDSRAAQTDRKAALVLGASRGIGRSFVAALLEEPRYSTVFAACRQPESAAALKELPNAGDRLHILRADVLDESSIAAAADAVDASAGRLDLLIYSAGLLHDEAGMQPEKRLSDVASGSIERAFRVNALGALLTAREFEPLLRRGRQSTFAALSARVGSIGDNRSGGWYAYRSSKAALNMMIKTLAIEWGRRPRPISCYALHPGTVATDLSAPFRKNRDPGSVFPPDRAARQLLEVLDGLDGAQSGGFFAYDGSAVEW